MQTLCSLRLVNRTLNASARKELFRLIVKEFSRTTIESLKAFFQEVSPEDVQLVRTIRLTEPIRQDCQSQLDFLNSLPMNGGLQVVLQRFSGLRRLELDHPLPSNLQANYHWLGQAAWIIPLLTPAGLPNLTELSIHLGNILSFEGILYRDPPGTRAPLGTRLSDSWQVFTSVQEFFDRLLSLELSADSDKPVKDTRWPEEPIHPFNNAFRASRRDQSQIWPADAMIHAACLARNVRTLSLAVGRKDHAWPAVFPSDGKLAANGDLRSLSIHGFSLTANDIVEVVNTSKQIETLLVGPTTCIYPDEQLLRCLGDAESLHDLGSSAMIKAKELANPSQGRWFSPPRGWGKDLPENVKTAAGVLVTKINERRSVRGLSQY